MPVDEATSGDVVVNTSGNQVPPAADFTSGRRLVALIVYNETAVGGNEITYAFGNPTAGQGPRLGSGETIALTGSAEAPVPPIFARTASGTASVSYAAKWQSVQV